MYNVFRLLQCDFFSRVRFGRRHFAYLACRHYVVSHLHTSNGIIIIKFWFGFKIPGGIWAGAAALYLLPINGGHGLVLVSGLCDLVAQFRSKGRCKFVLRTKAIMINDDHCARWWTNRPITGRLESRSLDDKRRNCHVLQLWISKRLEAEDPGVAKIRHGRMAPKNRINSFITIIPRGGRYQNNKHVHNMATAYPICPKLIGREKFRRRIRIFTWSETTTPSFYSFFYTGGREPAPAGLQTPKARRVQSPRTDAPATNNYVFQGCSTHPALFNSSGACRPWNENLYSVASQISNFLPHEITQLIRSGYEIRPPLPGNRRENDEERRDAERKGKYCTR